jgi:hypothetical protein
MSKVRPEEFTGEAILIWPDVKTSNAIPGWGFRIRNARTGNQVNTVSEANIHLCATDLAWAEFTMFAGPEGEPIEDGSPEWVQADGDWELKTATFNWLIVGMEHAELPNPDEAPALIDGQLELPFGGDEAK